MIVDQMASQLALSQSFLLKLAKTASHRYKEYTIPKRTGGERTIHHPARELKLVQHWLLRNVLRRLPVHSAATAYRRGSSIKRNADKHAKNYYLLRLDFKDFFPSLKRRDVIGILAENRTRLGINDDDIRFIADLVCRGQSLTIGAPTSPQLSNAILYEFDKMWSGKARVMNVTYTRYADDVYFSTRRPKVLSSLFKEIRYFLKAHSTPRLSINSSKTVFSSRRHKRLVTGLILTSDKKVSIGRPKKRFLKSMVLKLKLRQLDAHQLETLRGWISYVRSVEPGFVVSLQHKYDIDFGASEVWEVGRVR